MATFTIAQANPATNSRARTTPNRVQVAAGAATTSRSKPVATRAGDFPRLSPTSRSRSPSDRPGDLPRLNPISRGRLPNFRSMDFVDAKQRAGIIIPGDFRGVDITVRSAETGEILTDVKWVMSAQTFPTAARVEDDGTAQLPLLKTNYTTFMAVADREKPEGVDYTWFSNPDKQEPINPTDDEATIWLTPVPIQGLYAGSGTDFGGMLG